MVTTQQREPKWWWLPPWVEVTVGFVAMILGVAVFAIGMAAPFDWFKMAVGAYLAWRGSQVFERGIGIR